MVFRGRIVVSKHFLIVFGRFLVVCSSFIVVYIVVLCRGFPTFDGGFIRQRIATPTSYKKFGPEPLRVGLNALEKQLKKPANTTRSHKTSTKHP